MNSHESQNFSLDCVSNTFAFAAIAFHTYQCVSSSLLRFPQAELELVAVALGSVALRLAVHSNWSIESRHLE